ncbi:hypothetical protein TRVA0_021S02212 [Trichomonascus vanleenenianus]|uniref:uncharacterized protein n=1 Tax=Trichomonascus vanleenenianus TaxID=2268995 RepID=UPI003ECA0055
MAQGLKLGDAKTGSKESLSLMLGRAHNFSQLTSANKIDKCQGIKQFNDGIDSLKAGESVSSYESKTKGTESAASKTKSTEYTKSTESAGSETKGTESGVSEPKTKESGKSSENPKQTGKSTESGEAKTTKGPKTNEISSAPLPSSKDLGQGFGGITVTKTGSPRQSRSVVTVYKTTRPAAHTATVTKQSKRDYRDDRTVDILTNSIAQVLQIVTDNGWQVKEVDQKYLCPLISNSANATKFVNERLKQLKKNEGSAALSDPNSPLHRHAQALANAGYTIVKIHTTKNYTCDGIEQMKIQLDDLQDYASIMSVSNPMSATSETTEGVETGASGEAVPGPFASIAACLLALLLCLLTVILA